MSTMQAAAQRFREVCLDLAFQIYKLAGVLWLVPRLGAGHKPWVQERIERERLRG